MGYFSCKSSSSISTVDSPKSPPHHHNNNNEQKKPIKFNYSDLELAPNNFSHTKLLGRGSHGLVYKGVLPNGRQVAVKKPSPKFTLSPNPNPNPNELENEIDILSHLRSPIFVNLIGFTSNNPLHDRLLVVEFMSKGTLYDVLHSNSRPLNWGKRLKLALQTAKAVEILHDLSPHVIHRDIKSANVLIDRDFNARLGDFGLALRCADDLRLRSTPPAGTMGYLDPCYVTPDNVSTKTDVFSFGILLLEIVSGRKAIDMSNSPPSIVDWAIPLIRKGKVLGVYDHRVLPPKDEAVRKMLAVLAAKCVRSCRERRPSMKEVVECLSELSRMVPVHSWNGLANNPCLMVENVGKPVESRGVGEVYCENGRVSRNRGRVYSDLGFRRNLRDLMDGFDGESRFCWEEEDDDGGLESKESRKRVSSLRFEIGRLAERTHIRSLVFGNGKNRVSNVKPNRSVAERSDKFSEVVDDKVDGSNSVSQAVELAIKL